MRRAAVLAAVWAGALALAGPLEAQSELNRARAEFTSGRYEEAIAAFRQLAANADAAAVRGLVGALAAVGRYDEAVQAARGFADARPGSPEVWNALGEVLVGQGDLDGAERAFHRAAQGASDSLTARLNLAMLRYDGGDRAAAFAAFDRFIDIYNRSAALTSGELAAVATAVRYLGVRDWRLYNDALRAYDQAIAADPDNLDARVALGALFLEKFNGTDARATFDAVLRRNPRHPGALLGVARTIHFDGGAEAQAYVVRSLEVNPNFVAARAFLGRLVLELEDYEGAIREAERALDVNPQSPDALAVLAAAAFLQGDHATFEDARARVLAVHPRHAGLYVTLAEVAARNRHYDDAVRFGHRAVALDSSAWRGYAVLGVNQLRIGAMGAGRRSLERAFRGDPFDPWTKNTLDLLDVLDRYVESGSARFRVVAAPAETEVLALYLPALAEEAYDRLAARYGSSPAAPIRIEVFANHGDFSVRTIGLVGLGALGVSFGPVVAMDSPSARPVGEFNWGSTLWHELAHSFHLGMTDHRVPRWLSEGLAVHEERRARAGWGEDVTPSFLRAFLDGRLVPVSDLNRGFTRPAYPEQIIHSYYQASLVCELIERDHGFGAILALLSGYREGRTTPELFRTALGMAPQDFDRRFERYVRERFAGPLVALDSPPGDAEALARRARRRPGDYLAQVARGRRLLDEGRVDEARPFLERAKALFPEYAGAESPYWYLAQIYQRRGDVRAAAEELAAMTAINGRHYQALVALAGLQETLGDTAAAVDALERAVYVYPFEVELHERLAALAGGMGRWQTAVRERRAVLALDPVDRAETLYQLARAQHAAGDLRSARRSVLHALEVAPNFAAAQELLLVLRAERRR